MPNITKIKINGTEYNLPSGSGGAVTSVNGQTGDVVLDKDDIGLGNVPNVTTDNQTPTVTEASTRTNLAANDTLKTIIGKIKKWFADLSDLAFISKDGTTSTKYLRGDGTWQAFPTIPTVNNGTLKIQKNGTDITGATFTANQSGDTTVNITMAKADVGLDNVPNVTTNNQTPTITTISARVNLENGDTLSTIVTKIKKYFSDLKTVAFTGSYNDLDGKPTIPTVNNGTLTINQNNTQKGTFTANQSGNTTIDLTDTTYSDATQSVSGLMSSSDKSKLDLIEARAEVNQKALSKVKVGNNTVTSTEKTGTLELVAGANISLTLDPSTTKVTIDGSGSGGGLQRSGNGDIEIELYETSDRQLQFNNSDTGTALPIRLIDRTVSGAENNKTVAQLTKDAKLTLCIYNGSEWEPRIVFEPIAVASDNADYYKQLYFTDRNDTKRYILPQVLWTNSSPDDTFAAQTITVNANINNYRWYEIIFKSRGNFSSSNQKCKSTGLVPINTGTCLQRNFQYSETRDVTTPTYNSSTRKTSFEFAACVRYTSYGGSTTSNQNTICVPYQIIGHI